MKYIKLSNQNKTEVVAEVVEIIKSGGIVVLPFDTVYGIICDPHNPAAVDKIFEFKKRPVSKTLGLACDNLESIAKIAEIKHGEFIKEKIPGRFTFILKAKESTIVPECYQNGTIAIRIPDNELVLNIAKESGGVIAQTSANISDQPNCYSIDEIKSQAGDFIEMIDLIIDGGILPENPPSIIYDLSGETPRQIER